MAAVVIVRTDPTADASLAAIRERSRFGIAIAAIIRMIATTINNSINEKPFCFFLIFTLLGEVLRISFNNPWQGTMLQVQNPCQTGMQGLLYRHIRISSYFS